MNRTIDRNVASRPGKRRVGAIQVPWYWALPAVVMALLMRYLTVVAGGYYAFTDWNGISLAADFIGLENFEKILTRGVGLTTLWTTIRYAVGMIVFSNVLGMLFAVALEKGFKTRKIMRTMLFCR